MYFFIIDISFFFYNYELLELLENFEVSFAVGVYQACQNSSTITIIIFENIFFKNILLISLETALKFDYVKITGC